MITRPKNNYKKVYVVDKLCDNLYLNCCNVVKIEYMENILVHNGRIVIAYCSCGCGTLQYANFKGDDHKFEHQLNNGISINPLEFVEASADYKLK